MIRVCPHCGRAVEIPDTIKSGWYVCPYNDCSKTFSFDRDIGTTHKIEEPIEEVGENVIIIVCPNPDCRQKLRIPRTARTLEVKCPKCQISFRYPTGGKETYHNIGGLLAEFDKALEDEIKAVKTWGRDMTLVLKDGELIGEIAGEGVYQFNWERKIPVADETPAQIEIMGGNYRASIVRFLEFKLDVRITNFDGERIASALLKIDATYVLRKLKEALSFLSHRPQTTDLVLKAFNGIPPKCAVGNPIFTLVDKTGEGPDFYQAKATEICLGNEVSFIHGPPGTGKTRTLVNAVNDLANNGKRVLVSCHTNIACDNVLNHFLRHDHQKTVENLLNNGEIVRIGTPVLRDERVRALTIEAIYESLSKELLAEKERLTNLEDSLVEKKRRYYEYKQISLECEKAKERIANCERNISASKATIRRHIQEENELIQIISAKNQVLSIAEKRNAIANFFRGTSPKNLRLAIKNLGNEKKEKTDVRLEEERRLGLLLDEMNKLNTYVSGKLRDIPEGIRIEQIEDVVKEMESALVEANIQTANVEDRISKLNEGVLNNAKVVVST